jgi:hypothetical protein
MSKLGLEQLTYIGKSPSDDSLIVDDVNDRVGIGTSSPSAKLHVSSTGTPVFRIQDADGTDHYAQMSQATGSTIFDTRHGTNNGAFIFRGLGGGTADEYMRIDSDGDVGIGAAAPSGYRFEVTQSTAADLITRTYNSDTTSTSDTIHQYRVNNNAATNYIQFGDTASASAGGIAYHHSDNSLRFTTNAIDNFRMEADGDLHANGDVIAFSTTVSDERLKENIKIVDDALDKVKQLKGVTFNYTQGGKLSAGVIAQDVEKVLPEAVAEKKIPLKTDDGLLYKTVRYDALHSLLIEAIKELSAEVDELKKDR